MKYTVRRAVIAAVLLGVLLPALVAGCFFARSFYSEKLNAEISHSLIRNTDVVALGVRDNLWAIDREAATSLLDAIMRDESIVSIEILDSRLGRFVSRENPERRLGAIHTLQRPIMHMGKEIGVVQLSISENALRTNLMNQLLSAFGILSLQVLVSVLLILLVLQHRVGFPLLRLREEAIALAKGELAKPIVAQRNDEIGQVEQQLELTRKALQGLFGTLEQKNLALETDLRERIRVEAALRDREQRLSTLVEQSPLAVIEFDLGWHILAWNDAAVRTFGWPREEVLGRHISTLVADPHSITGERLATLACHRSDHTQIVCQWYNSVIRDEAGAPQRIVSLIEDVTEQQTSNEEIRKLATVLRLTSNLVALINPDGQIEWSNQAFEERFATALDAGRAEFSEALLACTENDIRIHVTTEITSAIHDAQRLVGLEFPVKCLQDNQIRWLSLDLQPLFHDNGNIMQWVAVLTDITDRRAIADALRNIAQIGADLSLSSFFNELLHMLTQGVGACAAYLATDAESWTEVEAVIAPPHWPLRCGRHPANACLGNRAGDDGTLIIQQGAARYLGGDSILDDCLLAQALIAEPITDSNRQPIGHIVMLFDHPLEQTASIHSLIALGAARIATEIQRHRTLKALQHSEQKFFSIFQHSPIAMALLRQQDGVCQDLNPAFLIHFGYRREEFIGRSVPDLAICPDAEDRLAMRELLSRDIVVSNGNIHLQTAAGDIRECQIHIRPFSSDNDRWLLVAFVDLTDLLVAQRQIQELNQSLEQRVAERTHALEGANAELEKVVNHLRRTMDELVRSEKLAALGSLVAGIAHELNTPIGNALLASSTLQEATYFFREHINNGLRRSTLDEYVEEAQTATGILMRNLGRAAELITSFKQVAADQTSSQRRSFDLAEVIGEIIITLHPVLRKSNCEVRNLIPSGITLDSYPGPLGQVIANLINNALIHAFEGRDTGQITLSATPAEAGQVTVSCTDNGNGINVVNLKRIFDPFFTTRHGRNGTGLGLNIVHNIVTGVLGGAIHVTSTEGAGSCFALQLPLIAPHPTEAETTASTVSADASPSSDSPA